MFADGPAEARPTRPPCTGAVKSDQAMAAKRRKGKKLPPFALTSAS